MLRAQVIKPVDSPGHSAVIGSVNLAIETWQLRCLSLTQKVKWQDLAMYEQTYAMHTLLQIRWQRTGVTVIEDFIHWNITKKITNNQSHLHMLPPYCLYGAGAEYNTKVILWRRSHCLIHLCTGCYILSPPNRRSSVMLGGNMVHYRSPVRGRILFGR